MVFRDLKEVEEASGLGKLVAVKDPGVGLGQVVDVILPADFGGLQSEMQWISRSSG